MIITAAQHVLALTLALVDVLARAWRMRVMLGIGWLELLEINTAGDALAAVTPARIGGEPVRFVGFQKAGAGLGATLSALATELWAALVIVVLAGVVLGILYAGDGIAWLGRASALLNSGTGRIVLAVILVLTLAGSLAAARLYHRLPQALRRHLREAWHDTRNRPPSVVAAVLVLTLISMAARAAILPVLAAHVSGVSRGTLILGSYSLLLGQNFLPTPSGAGPVELGFVAAFNEVLEPADLARLLLLWRFYSIILGAAVGAMLLVRLVSRGLLARPFLLPPGRSDESGWEKGKKG